MRHTSLRCRSRIFIINALNTPDMSHITVRCKQTMLTMQHIKIRIKKHEKTVEKGGRPWCGDGSVESSPGRLHSSRLERRGFKGNVYAARAVSLRRNVGRGFIRSIHLWQSEDQLSRDFLVSGESLVHLYDHGV